MQDGNGDDSMIFFVKISRGNLLQITFKNKTTGDFKMKYRVEA